MLDGHLLGGALSRLDEAARHIQIDPDVIERLKYAREMTKVFEETRAGTLAQLAGYYAEAPVRGEVTVVIAGGGKPAPVARTPDPEELARALLEQGLSRKDVADRVAEETGISRNTAYRLVNEL